MAPIPPASAARWKTSSGLRVGEEPLDVGLAAEVVARAAGNGDVVAGGLEPLDEVRAEEARPACDEDPHALTGFGFIQSTRPTQRPRFSAYHAIVRRMPSSHETRGSQPVSACSLS